MPLVYAVARRVIGARVPAALATLIFVLIPSMWGGALETKPYSLHLLLGVLALLLAMRWHDAGMPRLRYDPTLASLHDDPRFAALVKKMGFSEATP